MDRKELEGKINMFVSEVIKEERTKNSPEMVSAIAELLTSLNSICDENS